LYSTVAGFKIGSAPYNVDVGDCCTIRPAINIKLEIYKPVLLEILKSLILLIFIMRRFLRFCQNRDSALFKIHVGSNHFNLYVRIKDLPLPCQIGL
jgi:hypothetical protein